MRESIVAETVVTRKQIPVTMLLPAIVVMVFLATVAIGKSQVRSAEEQAPLTPHPLQR
jgi:hypothetical protein